MLSIPFLPSINQLKKGTPSKGPVILSTLHCPYNRNSILDGTECRRQEQRMESPSPPLFPPYKPVVLLSPLRMHPKPDDAKMQHSVGKGKRGTSPRLWKLNGMYILHPHSYARIHIGPYPRNTLVNRLLKKPISKSHFLRNNCLFVKGIVCHEKCKV